MFFDSWSGLLRVIVVGTLAYLALLGVLRVSGKRTLAKMSAFDLVVTVALGSTLATIVLSKDVALVEGVVALALLALLQFCIAALSVRWRAVERLAKPSPRLLLRDGHLQAETMRRERVTEAEVLAAIRGAGLGDVATVAAVVLETDGSLSVVSQGKAGARTALPAGDDA